jgi:hypothetical protein
VSSNCFLVAPILIATAKPCNISSAPCPKFDKIKIYKSEFTPMADALLEHKTTTALKLVCVGDDEKVIG